MRNVHAVVALQFDHLTNLRHLPPRFEVKGGSKRDPVMYHVTTHGEPRYEVAESGAITNFDVLIANQFFETADGIPWRELLPEKVAVVPRFDKISQALRINGFKLPEDSGHRKIATFSSDSAKNDQAYSFGTKIKGSVVLKPRHGARGVGHFVADTDKISIGMLIHDIRDQNIPVADIVTKYTPHVTYHGGMENYDNEGRSQLVSQGMAVQERVSGVKDEYRVLVDGNSEVFAVLPRSRYKMVTGGEGAHGHDYDQATGTSVFLDSAYKGMSLEEALPKPAHLKAFCKLVKAVVPPLNSVDLFVTEDGEWGIFEYCNQFGTVGVPLPVATDLHINYIGTLLDKHLA